MTDVLPSVTVIIPARPEQADINAVRAARQLDYPPDRLDILVARGRQPSVQRNTALKSARGEWIYFLDDDSEALPGNLRLVADYLRDPDVKVIGGPNLCPTGAPALERVFALVLASWLAFGPSRARYTPVGRPRRTSEKELILCNLLARRDALLELGGFNEALYPNEENALMDALQKRGGQLIYDPRFRVYRRPRGSVKAFAKMLMTYGRGRAEQFRLHPTAGSMLNFVPPLFCLYLVALAALAAATFGNAVLLWSAAPLAVYVVALSLQTVVSAVASGFVRAAAALPLLAASHVLYGVGFWRGLFTKLQPPGQRPEVPVALERMHADGSR